MAHKLILASAGAGKSERIAKDALGRAAAGEKVLVLTYTINNQAELVKHICRLNKWQPRNIVVKGWFTFLLEDMVRPYQRCVLAERVSRICFNSSNPHLRSGRYIRGRSEKKYGAYNPSYFVTKKDAAAHTTFLSKLSARIHEESSGRSAQRLADIYKAIYIDEVQDLVGWDFEIVRAIVETRIPSFDCVGDFRQTVYQTSIARKQPEKVDEKLAAFEKMGFVRETSAISWRCTQSICDLAHLIHEGDGHYERTISKINSVPSAFAEHQGVFAVPTSLVADYVTRYKPVILRWNKASETDLCDANVAYNFGEAKGIGFDRVLIIPTDKHARFLCGDRTAFARDVSDEARNKLYVGITRARYSVAFLHRGGSVIKGAEVWKREK